jgi:hypothetical protein
MLDYYEVKIAAPSTEISELGKLKLFTKFIIELSNNWIRFVLTIGIISGGVWANEA